MIGSYWPKIVQHYKYWHSNYWPNNYWPEGVELPEPGEEGGGEEVARRVRDLRRIYQEDNELMELAAHIVASGILDK